MTKKLMIVMKAIVSLFIVGLLLQPSSIAQAASSQRSKGGVEGTVADKFGARVTKASIKIESKRIKKEVTSDAEGRFQAELPAGVYKITVYSPGFESFMGKSVRVQAGQITTINTSLEVAAAGLCPKVKHKGKGIVICQ
jgi:hypothetical protein